MTKSFFTLSFTPVSDKDGNLLYESNLFQVNGATGIHLDMDGTGNSVTILRSLTGINFVSCFHDYFGETFDHILLQPGIGQICKLRVNKLPTLGIILGEIENMGDINPSDPDDLTNAFCGSDGYEFMGKGGEYFIGNIK